MPLAAPVAFDDLRPLILGDHALHLQEEIIFWALAQGPVEKNDLHPGPPEFIHEQDLIGVFAGEPVRRVHVQPIHRTRCHHIAEAFERGAHQGGSTVSVVKKLHGFGQCQAVRHHPLA